MIGAFSTRAGRAAINLTDKVWFKDTLFARCVRILLLCLSAMLFWLVVTVPLDMWSQVLFATCCLMLAFWARKWRTRATTMIMVAVSLIASSRYMYWRLTETLNSGSALDIVLGIILVSAEIYAFIVLVLGFIQTAWPLQRQPLLMPVDLRSWPTVDVFIPTYDEPLSVVKPTIFAALALDWPTEKINIYLLDDGRRPDFKEFCMEVGVTYLIRPDNIHAKAGNINAALPKTSGDYIAIFDCDHIPTRSFLQISMGWFVKNPNIAMVQTPHHFFSPDPFERNLQTFQSTPNEGELFYGLIQDGNDLWNASFFCGSCAVLQRKALLTIGGIAFETVTEDAHTALKLHRKGYETAYLRIPQAAGLATENLSSHVAQRTRWASGMAQIFRLDNPLFGKGLHLGQRLCYLNAMMHFFYAVPRIIFLIAPLAYLMFGAHPIAASAIQIGLFVIPHLLHSNITNTSIQGKFRHPFWNEVYESVLAWSILRPTLYAIINPKIRKFNVTNKGGTIMSAYFDWMNSFPFIVLFLLNLIGFILGVLRLTVWNDGETLTIILNMLWTTHNLLILGAAMAVASETRQIRTNPRVEMRITATLHLPGGRTMCCETENFSEGGFSVVLPAPLNIEQSQLLQVSLYRGSEEFVFPVKVMYVGTQQLGLKLEGLTTQQQKELVQCTFARGDLWLQRLSKVTTDTPMRALGKIFWLGAGGIFGFMRAASKRVLRTPQISYTKK